MNFSILEKAISIATQAHAAQLDKSHKPYILHLLRVMMKGKTEEEMVCGVLHDLIEDTEWTVERLKEEGFSEYIVEAIGLVTKKKDEDYSAFIERITRNDLAVAVKINDLEDNLNVSMLKQDTKKDAERLSKYINAYNYLKDYQNRYMKTAP